MQAISEKALESEIIDLRKGILCEERIPEEMMGRTGRVKLGRSEKSF